VVRRRRRDRGLKAAELFTVGLGKRQADDVASPRRERRTDQVVVRLRPGETNLGFKERGILRREIRSLDEEKPQPRQHEIPFERARAHRHPQKGQNAPRRGAGQDFAIGETGPGVRVRRG
jgi:hypothetical protein